MKKLLLLASLIYIIFNPVLAQEDESFFKIGTTRFSNNGSLTFNAVTNIENQDIEVTLQSFKGKANRFKSGFLKLDFKSLKDRIEEGAEYKVTNDGDNNEVGKVSLKFILTKHDFRRTVVLQNTDNSNATEGKVIILKITENGFVGLLETKLSNIMEVIATEDQSGEISKVKSKVTARFTATFQKSSFSPGI